MYSGVREELTRKKQRLDFVSSKFDGERASDTALRNIGMTAIGHLPNQIGNHQHTGMRVLKYSMAPHGRGVGSDTVACLYDA
jgi:hypothetical protein